LSKTYLVPVILKVEAGDSEKARRRARSMFLDGFVSEESPLAVHEWGEPRVLIEPPSPDDPAFLEAYSALKADLGQIPRPEAVRLANEMLRALQRDESGHPQSRWGKMAACQDLINDHRREQSGVTSMKAADLQAAIDRAKTGAL
jgi:hypothetical protein